MKSIGEIHKEPGMHKTLLFNSPNGLVIGWTYEELGWNMTIGGVVSPVTVN